MGARELVLLHPTRSVKHKHIELGLRVTAALKADRVPAPTDAAAVPPAAHALDEAEPEAIRSLMGGDEYL